MGNQILDFCRKIFRKTRQIVAGQSSYSIRNHGSIPTSCWQIDVIGSSSSSRYWKILPRNVGKLDGKKKNVGTGLVGAPACGDVMKLQIEVDDNGNITDAKFKTFGCGSAIASSSLATEWIKGKSISEAGKIKNSDIAKELCLPPVKLHCSMLA